MGSRGPVPYRSEERTSRPAVEVTKIEAIGSVEQPELMIPDAHPFIVELWESLGESGQSMYYEPSDWAFARFILHFADGLLKNARPSAQMLQSVNSALSDLLVSEGARRRVRLEVERQGAQADVVDLAQLFQERMGLA